MKIAIVHDWFNDVGGAEKVVRRELRSSCRWQGREYHLRSVCDPGALPLNQKVDLCFDDYDRKFR